MSRSVVRTSGAAFMVLWIALGVLAPAAGSQGLAGTATAVMDNAALAGVAGGNGACIFLDGVSVGLGISTLFGCGPCGVAAVVVGGAGLLCGMIW